jgi:hypothetical protein
MSNQWTTWTSLGKPGETDRFIALVLGSHHDRSLAVFAGGPNHELFLRSETGDGSWSEWERIGDDTVHVNSHDLAVSTHADGRLGVFALHATSISPLTEELRHLAQTAPNGGWGTWQNLGAPPEQGGFVLDRSTRGRVVVGQNADRRLEVLVLHWGNIKSLSPVADVWQVWETTPNGDWSHWGKLGAIPKRSPATPFNLEVASNQDGRQELFVVGEIVGLWHIWQTSPNNGCSCWRDEEHSSWDSIAVGRNPDGCLQVFLTDGTGSVSYMRQTALNNGWSDWLSLGNPEGVRLDTLAVESTSDGLRLELFAKDDSDAGSFWHIRQTEPDGSDWNTWESLGRPEGAAEMPHNPNLSAFVVGRNQSDRIQLLASDRKGEVWTILQK